MRLLPAFVLSAAALCAAAPLPSLDSSYALPPFKDLEARARHAFSGLRFIPIKEGKGPRPAAGALLKVKYIGWTPDGVEFDASHRSAGAFEFTLGAGQVIRGWDEGLGDMRKGERRILIIPPELGYGNNPPGSIPPNSILVFDVELVDF